MKPTAFRVLWICLTIALVGMGIRLACLTAQTESGYSVLVADWRDGTIGYLTGKSQSIARRPTEKQAAYWLRETDRVLARQPENAEVAIGAALVLDSPSLDYAYRHTRHGPVIGPHLDWDAVAEQETLFESLCRERCLQLAKTATELEPENLQWWQLRAILLWRTGFYSDNSGSRVDDWQTVLDECQTGDPDNGLYDYLAAMFLWEMSCEIDIVGEDTVLRVEDHEGNAEANRRFEQGLQKPLFVFGDDGYVANRRFLNQSGLPRFQHPSVINHRRIISRRSTILFPIVKWRQLAANAKEKKGDLSGAHLTLVQNRELVDQFIGSSNANGLDNVSRSLRRSTAEALLWFEDEHPGFIAPKELASLKETLAEVEREADLMAQAAQQIAGEKTTSNLMPNSWSWAQAIIADLIPSLVTLLVGISIGGLLIGRIFRKDTESGGSEPARKIHWQALFCVLAPLIALAATLIVLGAAPSEMIGRDVQPWVLSVIVILIPLAVIVYLGFRFATRRRFRFSLRGFLLMAAVFGLLFGVISICEPGFRSFARFPFDLSIAPLSEEAEFLPLLKSSWPDQSAWLWVLIQWSWYHGAHWTLLLWFGILAFAFFSRRKKTRNEDASSSTKSRFRILIRSLAGTSLLTALILLLIYFALMPGMIRWIEADYQEKMAFSRNPQAYWLNIKETVQSIRNQEAPQEN